MKPTFSLVRFNHGFKKIFLQLTGMFLVTLTNYSPAVAQDAPDENSRDIAPREVRPNSPDDRVGPENPLALGTTTIPLASDETKRGWSRYVSLGLTGNSNDSKKVIGKADGMTTSIGTKVLVNLSLREDNVDWRNNLNFAYTTSKSPYINEYVKSEDLLNASSLYIFRLPGISWFGPFARVDAKTTTSKGRDVRARVHDYVIQKRDDTFETRTGDRIALNDPWKPTILKETVGGYFELYGSKMANVELFGGIGARQVYAKNQLVSIDNPHSDEIELLQLNDSTHLGPEAILQIHGLLFKDLISYSVVSDALFPAQSTGGVGEKEMGYNGRIVETDVNISIKLAKWLALDYTVTSLLDRDLSDEAQMSNTVQFNASYAMSI